MKKFVKYTVIAIILIACVAGGVYYMMMPLSVRLTELSLRTAELSFTEQGVVAAENTMLVFSSTNGGLQNLYVNEGQEIRAGEILLSIDTTALELQLTQIENGIRGLEAQLANVDVENAAARRNLETTRTSLQGELQAINAQAAEIYRSFAGHQELINEQLRVQEILISQHQRELEQANEHFWRIHTLFEGGVIAYTEYDTARQAVVAAEARLEVAEAQLSVIAAGTVQTSAEHFEGLRESLIAQINGITAQLASDTTAATRAHFQALIEVERANIARIEHEKQNAVVFAPIDGVITTLHALNTNFITTPAPIAEITTQGNRHIEVYVSTQDTNSISVGSTVGLTLRQRDGDIQFFGTISEIDNTAVVRLTALGVEERKVSVRVLPETPENVNFGIGYGVDVTFYIFREENQLTVPHTALFREDGADMVWLVTDGMAEAVLVTTGTELRTETIILSGLSPGDFVISDANNPDISDGTRVVAE